VLGDGRLDDVQLPCDLRDAAGLGHPAEDVELAESYASVEQGDSPEL
jgi:hypothetical protein